MEFKHRLVDTLVRARMIKEPFVVVEGKDDRQIYSRIAVEINKEAKIHAVAEFEDFHAGCESVIQCLTQLQAKLANDETNRRYVLGIIDRDSRPYKGDTTPETLINLHILKYYSIESYFATKKNLVKILEKITHATFRDIDDEIIEFVLNHIREVYEPLYYVSLDALKQECLGADNYQAIISYGAEMNLDKLRHLATKILPMNKMDLDAFASEKGIDFTNLKLVVNGKWMLRIYLFRAREAAVSIDEKWRNKDLRSQTPYMSYFKLKTDHKIADLHQDALQFIDHEECSDIIEAINTLG
ncbi:DUF4435 domain-containing protein [Haliscomenobacter sp.]|uniref:DUF4435 domain-containing protein n=1 Tax=Haliscomenobacter sp. TaxID=2717303 RepID=UPI0035939B8F